MMKIGGRAIGLSEVNLHRRLLETCRGYGDSPEYVFPVPPNLLQSAMHEAGHAVAAAALGDHVNVATIESTSPDDLGRVVLNRMHADEDYAVIALSGPMAEVRFCIEPHGWSPDLIADSGKSDYNRVAALNLSEGQLDECCRRASYLLDRHAVFLQCLAEMLILHRSLWGVGEVFDLWVTEHALSGAPLWQRWIHRVVPKQLLQRLPRHSFALNAREDRFLHLWKHAHDLAARIAERQSDLPKLTDAELARLLAPRQDMRVSRDLAERALTFQEDRNGERDGKSPEHQTRLYVLAHLVLKRDLASEERLRNSGAINGIGCPHDWQPLRAGKTCWLCDLCQSAVCPRCRKRFQVWWPIDGSSPWWTPACSCRESVRSPQALCPPVHWTAEHDAAPVTELVDLVIGNNPLQRWAPQRGIFAAVQLAFAIEHTAGRAGVELLRTTRLASLNIPERMGYREAAECLAATDQMYLYLGECDSPNVDEWKGVCDMLRSFVDDSAKSFGDSMREHARWWQENERELGSRLAVPPEGRTAAVPEPMSNPSNQSEETAPTATDSLPHSLVSDMVTRAELTVLRGPLRGTVVQLDSQTTVTFGRSDQANVVIPDPRLSRIHARVFSKQTPTGVGFLIEDCDSANGTFILDQRISAPTLLKDGSRIGLGLGTVLCFLRQDAQKTEGTPLRDPLTGLLNRSAFEQYLHSDLALNHREGSPVALFLFRLDGSTNLSEGILAVQEALRRQDVLGLCGGKRFAVILQGVTRRGARELVECARSAVENKAINGFATTVSVGGVHVSFNDLGTENGDAMVNPAVVIELAAEALRNAEGQGGNRVVMVTRGSEKFG